MAKTYTAAGSATAGEVYTAAAHNVIVEDINNLIVRPILRIRRPSTQTITTATNTFVSWTTEDIDTDGMFTATSDTVTIQTPGVYYCSAGVSFANAANGARFLTIAKNPSSTTNFAAIFAGACDAPNATQRQLVCASGIQTFAANDTIKVVVFQDSGGNVDIGSASFTGDTYLNVVWIGKTTF